MKKFASALIVVLGTASLIIPTARLLAVGLEEVTPLMPKPSFTAADRDLIRKWVREQIKDLLDNTGTPKYDEIRKNMLALLGNGEANAQSNEKFVEEYSTILAGELAAEISKPGASGASRLSLLLILGQVNNLAASAPLIALVDNPNLATRYWAAKGLASLKTALGAPKAEKILAKAVAKLVAQGLKEKSDIVLGQIYAALSIPASDVAVKGFCDLLDKRLDMYVAGTQTTIEADASAAIEAQLMAQDATEKNKPVEPRLVGVLGRLLACATLRYVLDYSDLDDATRASYQRVIFQAETSLSAVCGSTETPIVAAMKKGALVAMKDETLKWVGGAGVKKYKLETFNVKPPVLPTKATKDLKVEEVKPAPAVPKAATEPKKPAEAPAKAPEGKAAPETKPAPAAPVAPAASRPPIGEKPKTGGEAKAAPVVETKAEPKAAEAAPAAEAKPAPSPAASRPAPQAQPK